MQDLTVILPKQKRLKEAFAPIMEAADLHFSREKSRHAYGVCVDGRGDLPVIDAAERKPLDALRKLKSGAADLAVMGVDKFIEAKCQAELNGERFGLSAVADFNCAACRMYIAAKPSLGIESAADLEGKTIATAFPYSLKAWLSAQDVQNVEIIECDGDSEDEVRDGSADAIFEIVDSGQSLIDNGLETKLFAYNVQAVLVASSSYKLSPNAMLAQDFINRLAQKETVKQTAPPIFQPEIKVDNLCYA
ncbi:MAG: ATP phosphoribosyltransferase [Pseudomonadota bacterium]|jgi:ATP phosphoribosyltransferase|nr:ATP phosphoribosyltransferase [Alphaproteobacteria bacterium]MEC7577103.1 ATP phosphoribosyltransferase [Pseudomonadota bacterium]MEC7703195.1 ATP phosphoribosyltransferase [Pseudomonadota bacterium]MEC9235258.1 ATP phosphoribosyltransferase [Pseudomonadota bacterium]MED5423162.1 ATP phosphoribosyltransferase [Pseudomonadota bacterium]